MNVYIIAGPNGAGKTTFALKYLERLTNCGIFLNADIIAAAFTPGHPESVAIQAGRELLGRIQTCSSSGEDFAFETTISGKSHLQLISRLKRRGYKAHLYYLWIPSVEVSVARVRERISKGGHAIPERDIRRRYDRSLVNFFRHYRHAVDAWSLHDNSGLYPELIASENEGLRSIINRRLFETLESAYSKP